MEITDNETEEELIKPLHTLNPIEITKKEQEALQSNYNTFMVAGNDVDLNPIEFAKKRTRGFAK